MLALTVVALEVPLAESVEDRVDAEVRSQARAQADLAAATVADMLGPKRRRDRDRVVDAVAASARGRVIVVDRTGRLIADSATTSLGRDYGDRPEVQAALANRRDQRVRESDTLDQALLATTVPVLENGRAIGAVRITQSVEAVNRAVRRAWLGLALIGVVVLGVGLLVGSLLAGNIARPLRRLDLAARRVAEGDLAARVEVEGSAEQRSLARTFNRMTERLQRLVRSQRLFVADASHQLRTPLTGLRLRLEAMGGTRLEPEAEADLEAALREVDRLSQMVTELLELSRAGERDAPGEPLLLAEVAERAAARWEAAAADRHQAISCNLDAASDQPVWIATADADRIIDVLIENALNYSPANQTTEIIVSASAIEVRDRGSGIGEEEAEELFERFHRGRAGRQGHAGSGLGLPIARELARRWSGDVTLDQRHAGGTVARLQLPGTSAPVPPDASSRTNFGKEMAKPS